MVVTTTGLETETQTGTRPEQPITLPPIHRLSPSQALSLPLVFTAGLALILMVGSVQQNQTLRWSILGVATALIVWSAALFASIRRTGRLLKLEIAERKQ